METFLRVDINILAALLLVIVHIIAYKRLDRKDYLNMAFSRASGIIVVQLMIETATCIINKRPEMWLIPLSYILHMMLFSFAPILTYYLYMLVKGIVYNQNKKNIVEKVALLFPVMINTVLAILSPIYHLIFYIDCNNVYKRGSLFIVFAIATYAYFLATLFYLIRFKKKIIKSEFKLLFIFCILPIVGGLIQTFFYGPLLMWSTVAFSLLIIYLFLQQRMIHIDYLTGAWDRGSFEYYMATRLGSDKEIKIGLVYVDIDELKKINDQYGHAEGDFAIKESIVCIKKVLHKNDIIVRMGGDEFIIILDCQLQEEMDVTLQKIQESITLYNETIDKKYEISCSLGGAIYDSGKGSIEEFMNHIDNLMYQNKAIKKRARIER